MHVLEIAAARPRLFTAIVGGRSMPNSFDFILCSAMGQKPSHRRVQGFAPAEWSGRELESQLLNLGA
jgi:hypothetical protein